jgi:hypothetical protein
MIGDHSIYCAKLPHPTGWAVESLTPIIASWTIGDYLGPRGMVEKGRRRGAINTFGLTH